MPDDMMEEEAPVEEGAPEWMVTFGDMMSLLLTFFIMLLSMSHMDMVKYRQVAESLNGSFGSTKTETEQYEKRAKLIEKNISNEQEALKVAAEAIAEIVKDSQLQKFIKVEFKDDKVVIEGKVTEQLKSLESTTLIRQLNSVVESENMQDKVKVVVDPRGIAVRLTDKSLFSSGKASIKKQSYKVLYKIGKVIREQPGAVLIEGHTDDIPIRTRQYPSNWELSSARAASVARFVLKFCKLDKTKVQIAGLADTKPLVPNTNAKNRSLNRRVEFIFLK